MSSSLQSLILRQIASVKNSTVAEAIGHDESHVSRVTSDERGLKISELENFFTALGLRVIQCDGQVVQLPKQELEALRVLARKALEEK